MADGFDFDPDLSLEDETEKAEVLPYKPTTIVQNSDKSVTLNHMVDMMVLSYRLYYKLQKYLC